MPENDDVKDEVTQDATPKGEDTDAKLKEFRQNNIDLMKKVEKLEKGAKLNAEEKEELAKYRKAQEDAAEEEARKKGQWEGLLQKRDEKYQIEAEKWAAREGNLVNSIRQIKVKADVAPLLAQYKGDYDLLEGVISKRTRTEETDDGFEVVVLDDDGQPMLGEKGEVATMEDLVLSLREHKTWGKAFEGVRGHGGGGSHKTGESSGGDNPWHPDSKNITEQMRITRTNPALAKQLKTQAGVK